MNGTPMIVMIIPTGISIGWITVLAMVSVPKRSKEPISAEQGNINL